jgi:hypothetical protein
MKARELRIGNYITAKTTIFSNEIVVKINGEWVNGMPADNFIGIPITEEWLLKAGFKDHKILCGMMEIQVRPFETVIQGIIDGKWLVSLIDDIPTMLRSIQYIHELQNLYFALTGEELEFKV